MRCPKCNSDQKIKNGIHLKKQRYRCKECKYNYTREGFRGIGLDEKIKALKLYREGLGFRSIARVLGVSNVSVLRWIRNFGRDIKKQVLSKIPDDLREIEIVEMDEMWHFTLKKNEKYGFGLQWLEKVDKSLRFQLVLEGKKRLKNL